MGCAHLPLACIIIIIIIIFEVSMQRFFFFLIQKYVTFLFYLMVDINCKFISTSFSILSNKQISFSSLQFSILPSNTNGRKLNLFYPLTFLSFLHFLSSQFFTPPTKQTLTNLNLTHKWHGTTWAIVRLVSYHYLNPQPQNRKLMSHEYFLPLSYIYC